MKPIEIYLPCYGKGVYSFNKEHERYDQTIELTILGKDYVFHYCECYKAQAELSSFYYGWLTILLHYIVCECGIFSPIKVNIINGTTHISRPNNLVWYRNSNFDIIEKLRKDKNYEQICRDSFNTYFIKL
jgi:hypothetical protein